MTAYKDFEEKSVDKAVERASSELGIGCSSLKYDIISHGSSGIFGLVGAKKAVIRVCVPDRSVSESVDTDQVNISVQESDNGENDNVTALVDEAFGTASDPETSLETPSEILPEGHEDTLQTADESQADSQAVTCWVREFLDKIVALISPDSEIEFRNGQNLLHFEIKGGDSARLIGKHGQTLDAIHYLMEKGVYKQFGATLPIEIDVEGYLEKRRSELTALASKLAQKARQTGKPMVINRISAQDRRVVHICLRDDREVRTQSVGNGDLRKLLIMPRKKNQAKRPRSKNQ